jgi:hypothetical protein
MFTSALIFPEAIGRKRNASPLVESRLARYDHANVGHDYRVVMQSRAAPTTRRLHTIASFTASASR